MKKNKLLFILMALIIAVNVTFFANQSNKSSELKLDSIELFASAQSEEGEGGFWFWVTKTDFCNKYGYKYENGEYKYGVIEAIPVNSCKRGLDLDCETGSCPQGYIRS